jgi:hypothetical protein
MVRPALTYGASLWQTPEGVLGHRKGTDQRLQAIQGKCLRTITGAYKATSTEALEIETFVPPLDLYTQLVATKTTIRIRTTKAAKGIRKICDRIQQQATKGRGRRPAKINTPTENTLRWAMKPTGMTQPPKTIEELKTAYNGLRGHFKQKWKERWEQGKKGAHTRAITPTPDKAVAALHQGLRKAESAVLTQLRTGKIGFNSFLYARKVPGIASPDCECNGGPMTVRHVVLECPKWQQEREELGEPLRTNDLRRVLSSKEGCRAAIKLVLRTKLLEQFKGVEER